MVEWVWKGSARGPALEITGSPGASADDAGGELPDERGRGWSKRRREFSGVPKSENGKIISALYSKMTVDGVFGVSVKALTGVPHMHLSLFMRGRWPKVLGAPGTGEGVVAGTTSGVDEVKRADDVVEPG